MSDDYNKLTNQIERMMDRQTDLIKRVDELYAEVKHGQKNHAMVNVGIEKLITKIDALEERVEKLEGHNTWFIRGISGLVITALGVLLFKNGSVKPT